MNAEIITIGQEILIGQILDTNSTWLASELDILGYKVQRIITVSDTKEAIRQAVAQSEKTADLVLITGGLGPTSDDITKPVLAEFFETELVFNQEAYDNMSAYVLKRGGNINPANNSQAIFPKNCELITNLFGTASGMLFRKNNKVFVSMPGVPFEMKNMFIGQVIPKLKTEFKLSNRINEFISTFGIPEAQLAEKLSVREKSMSEKLSLAYLPSPERVILRLGIEGCNFEEIQEIIQNEIKEFSKILGDYIYSYTDSYLEKSISVLLSDLKQTVATAESCTGGNVGRLITSVPGSSAYFEGGVIAYSNRIKHDILGVKNETLEKYGAVSEQTVIEMAEGIRKLYKSDYGVAVSGVAGPDGGSPEKPVGTVWICVSDEFGNNAKKYSFGNLREVTVRRASATALDMLRLMIKKRIDKSLKV